MLKNYFKIGWRNLVKNKVYALINIFGLAISLTCCILISAYIYNQITYDSYSKDSKNIYRVELQSSNGTTINEYPSVDAGVGVGLKNAFPEIAAYTRFISLPGFFMSYQEKQFKENEIAVADTGFFEIFTIPFVSGNARDALAEPNTIVITKEFAKKYFGTNDPMGKSLKYSLFRNDLKVTGVIEPVPDNSHFHFNAFISRTTLPYKNDSSWINYGTFTYLKLNKNADALKLQSKFPQLVAEHVVGEVQKNRGVTLQEAQKTANNFVFKLRPVSNIHLYSKTKYELEPPGDIQYVYIFGALCFFILSLACVNFVNLSTANAAGRAREVGIRKVMGSLKKQLVLQFLSESVLVSSLALVIALLLVWLLLPWYNQLSGEMIDFSFFLNPVAISSIAGVTLLTGLTAGIYPAFFISSFQPIKALKGLRLKGKSLLRNALVVFQFSVSLVLIIATLVVYDQLHFMLNRKPGYNKEQIMIINNANLLKKNQDAFRQQLLQDRYVTGVSNAFGVPADMKMGGTHVYPGQSDAIGNQAGVQVNLYNVDYDYIPVLQMQIAAGRNFSRNFPTDSADGAIINETAAGELGWNNNNAIGQKILRPGQTTLTVIGVVKDFQYASAKQSIAPLMMLLRKGNSYLVRINTANVNDLLSNIQNTWNSFSTGTPLEYTFLDDNFNKLYRSEQITGKTFTIFSVIAILIASMGLLGLISYVTVSRTKEIAVRKVLGSSVHEIVLMLSKNFVSLISISLLIAVPVSWWAMNKWLNDFAYRIEINWWIFVAAGVITLGIALLTIGFHIMKAAITNPVNSLRSE